MRKQGAMDRGGVGRHSCRSGRRAGLADQAGQDRGAFRRGRECRRHGAHRGGESAAAARPAGHRREQDRRRLDDRLGGGRAGGARWLHAADDLGVAHQQPRLVLAAIPTIGRRTSPSSPPCRSNRSSCWSIHPIRRRTSKSFLEVCEAGAGQGHHGHGGSRFVHPDLAGLLLEQRAGVKFEAVHYRGTAPSLADLMANTDLFFSSSRSPRRCHWSTTDG